MNESINELKNFLESKFSSAPLEIGQIDRITSLINYFQLKEIYDMIDLAYTKTIKIRYQDIQSKKSNKDFISYLFGIANNKQKDVFENRKNFIINIVKNNYSKWDLSKVKSYVAEIFVKLRSININEKEMLSVTYNIINMLYDEKNPFKNLDEFQESVNFLVDLYVYQP